MQHFSYRRLHIYDDKCAVVQILFPSQISLRIWGCDSCSNIQFAPEFPRPAACKAGPCSGQPTASCRPWLWLRWELPTPWRHKRVPYLNCDWDESRTILRVVLWHIRAAGVPCSDVGVFLVNLRSEEFCWPTLGKPSFKKYRNFMKYFHKTVTPPHTAFMKSLLIFSH